MEKTTLGGLVDVFNLLGQLALCCAFDCVKIWPGDQFQFYVLLNCHHSLLG
jgi:hypothetical protein